MSALWRPTLNANVDFSTYVCRQRVFIHHALVPSFSGTWNSLGPRKNISFTIFKLMAIAQFISNSSLQKPEARGVLTFSKKEEQRGIFFLYQQTLWSCFNLKNTPILRAINTFALFFQVSRFGNSPKLNYWLKVQKLSSKYFFKSWSWLETCFCRSAIHHFPSALNIFACFVSKKCYSLSKTLLWKMEVGRA